MMRHVAGWWRQLARLPHHDTLRDLCSYAPYYHLIPVYKGTKTIDIFECTKTLKSYNIQTRTLSALRTFDHPVGLIKKSRCQKSLRHIRTVIKRRYEENIRHSGYCQYVCDESTNKNKHAWNYQFLNRYSKKVGNNYIRTQPFSTSSQELSLENAQVQEYLNSLKEKYGNACTHTNEANMKVIRTLKPIVDLIQEVEVVQSEVDELRLLAVDGGGDKEMRNLAREDLKQAEDTLIGLQEQLLDALVPEDAADNTNIVLEVSAGIGGQEAMLFCSEVFNMYQGFADYMGWHTEITDYETSDIGGLRHATMLLSGEMVYRVMKYEGGTHRVQRVPKTEKAGRIHTSTVSVAVMPQPTEIDIQISDKDLKIETKRASGAGGQHVNTTDSAVRIVHLPTGLTVESQEQRSQHQNRESCLRKLRALLYQRQLEENAATYSSNRKLQVGTKARSEKIRTYNFPQDRVTDHRIGASFHNLSSFLSGAEDLYSLISQLLEEAKREALQELINSPQR